MVRVKSGWPVAVAAAVLTAFPAVADDDAKAELAKKLADTVAELMKQVAAKPDDAKLRGELTKAYLRIGAVYMDLGKPQEAEATYRKGLELAQQTVVAFPTDTASRANLAAAHDGLGQVYMAVGRIAEAEQHFQQAMVVSEKLVADAPKEPGYRRGLARSTLSLGRLYVNVGKLDQALACHHKAVAMIEKLMADDAKNEATYLPDLYRAFHGLTVVLKQTGRTAEATATEQKTKEIETKIKKLKDSADKPK